MGSGASKDEDIVEDELPTEDIDNYNELYTDQQDEKIVDVPLDAFPCMKNSRFWQAKNLVEPTYDPETSKLLPKPHVVDQKSIDEIIEKPVKIEVEEVLLTSSIDTLVESLTKNCDTDAEKVLTFYRWMRAVETNTPSANEDHAAYYFAKSHKQPISLLELFQKLCGSCNIQCEIIRGFAKGATFAKQLGNAQIKLKEPNHHWLAVALSQFWYLIDLTWCVQQKTDFYFLCEPAIFIYNHLPLQEEWQLLFRPVTKTEFTDLAFLHKSFYYHELELISHQTATIKSLTGEEVIRIDYKEERIWSYRLTCEKGGTIVNILAGVPLEKCLMLEAFEGKARFNVRMPSQDKFRLDIFCQDPEYTATSPSLVCTYFILAQKGLSNFVNFPAQENVSKLWGPTAQSLTTGLVAKSHKRGRIFVEESAQITFDSKKEQFLVCHLETEQETDFDLEQCVIDSYSSEEKEVSVNILLPQTGLYKLVVYLEPDGGSDKEKVYVISYLLECIRPFSQRLVFQNYGDKLGIQSMKKVLQEAIRTKSLHKLRASVALMKTNKMSDKLPQEAALAEDMLQEMEKIDEMKQAIEKTDRGTMTEVRNYSKPPQAVHDVLTATFLLLGDHEDATKLWTDVQSRCGNVGKFSLSRRIRMFNILYVHHEISKRSMEILDKQDVNVLQTISPGAALFYSWALSVNMEVLNRVDHKLQVIPAPVKRQKEIFSMIAKGEWPKLEAQVVPEISG